jgi:23S rRNA (adenine2503-C2)-methyltransferase
MTFTDSCERFNHSSITATFRSHMQRVLIKDFTLPQLEGWVKSLDEQPFRARQLFRHLYVRHVNSWEECSDLSKSLRSRLESGAILNALELAEKRQDADGTSKYLFALQDGQHIESVLIPDPPRYTLCVSSQVGCALGCTFCRTGALRFQRNLQVAEIVDQVCRVQRDLAPEVRISNLVFMGMGEPLANYAAVVQAIAILLDPNGLAFSHRRITLSTVGLIPQLQRLGEELPVNLAISLHAAEDRIRDQLMPINRTYPLRELMAACRSYLLPARKRITFEYLLLEGVNDSLAQARKLVKLLHGTRAKVNLIPFNEYPDSVYRKPSEEQILAFQEVLTAAHLTATIRRSRGSGISAACGQLAAQQDKAATAAVD